MRGLYRYNTGGDRWWACVEDDGQRVNIVRRRYEEMNLQPPFEQLPIEENGATKPKRTARK